MKRLYGRAFLMMLMSLLVGVTLSVADTGWERYEADGPLLVDHPRFSTARTIYPQCSGGPVVVRDVNGDIIEIRAGHEQFAFFVNRGMPDRLLIFLDGGGACWDNNTCLLSPFFVPPAQSTYEQEITENFDTEGAPLPGGILEPHNPNNPFYGWTMVFIPYCTGDVHWGSHDADYTSPVDGSLWQLHHRGFDNFLAVLDWLQNDMGDYLPQMAQVAVAGSSAGAYGAMATFPYIKELLPAHTLTYLIADAGSGVLTQQFVTDALSPQWDIVPNLATWIPGIDASLFEGPDAASTLIVSMVSSLARAYPDTRIAQYTTAWDAIQTRFLNIMTEIEAPERWADPVYLVPRFCEWSAKAQIQAYESALEENYGFYIGAGTNHTVLPSVPLPGFGDVYTEDSAKGVPLVDWLHALLDDSMVPAAFSWTNVRCSFGKCEPPFHPVLCLTQ